RACLIFNQNMDDTSSRRLAEVADRFIISCDIRDTQVTQASFDNMQGIIRQQIFEAQKPVQEQATVDSLNQLTKTRKTQAE
ncbi:unnamed protein product, partial [Rotaria socialis]